MNQLRYTVRVSWWNQLHSSPLHCIWKTRPQCLRSRPVCMALAPGVGWWAQSLVFRVVKIILKSKLEWNWEVMAAQAHSGLEMSYLELRYACSSVQPSGDGWASSAKTNLQTKGAKCAERRCAAVGAVQGSWAVPLLPKRRSLLVFLQEKLWERQERMLLPHTL